MYNFIDGDFFESLADYSFGDMYSSNMTEPSNSVLSNIFEKYEKPILFIETHRLGSLFNTLLNFPNNKVIVIAHNSDATFGIELFNNIPDNVEKIWCQNYNYLETDRIKSLPIGLERVRWFPEQKKQEVLYSNMNSECTRDKLVYMNFNPGTNVDRQGYYNELKDKSFVTNKMIGNGGDYNTYVQDMLSHKYVISPPGNGIDCHRNWEAIYLGCIPIVIDSQFNRNIFSELPVLIVDNYQLDEEFLVDNYDYIKNKRANIDIINKNYWTI